MKDLRFKLTLPPPPFLKRSSFRCELNSYDLDNGVLLGLLWNCNEPWCYVESYIMLTLTVIIPTSVCGNSTGFTSIFSVGGWYSRSVSLEHEWRRWCPVPGITSLRHFYYPPNEMVHFSSWRQFSPGSGVGTALEARRLWFLFPMRSLPRIFLGVVSGRQDLRLTTSVPALSQLCSKFGNLDVSQPYGSPWTVA
jgi:hypothetical protein